jgi:peptidoglycan/LPS O-acetylase OafA/YrhL
MCCLLVALAGVCGGLDRPTPVLFAWALAYAGYAGNMYLFGSAALTHWKLVLCFLTGSVYSLCGRRIPHRSWILVLTATCLLLLGLNRPPLFSLLFPVAGGYLFFALILGSTPKCRESRHRIDLSYGIYVYASPVQQAVLHWTGTRDPIALTATVIPIVLGIAWLSSRFVETPLVMRKRKPVLMSGSLAEPRREIPDRVA